VDCDLIKSPGQVQKFISEFDSSLANLLSKFPNNQTTNVSGSGFLLKYSESPEEIVSDRILRLLDYQLGKRSCQKWYQGIGELFENRAPAEYKRKRRKRFLGDLKEYMIWPGTNWCGHGSKAKHYDDLGLETDVDRCCRQHDMCPYMIEGFKYGYSYFNWQLHTLNHCDCEIRFHNCLKTSTSGAASIVKKVYFSLLNRKCFELELMPQCEDRSWWGSCQKDTLQWSAQLKTTQDKLGNS